MKQSLFWWIDNIANQVDDEALVDEIRRAREDVLDGWREHDPARVSSARMTLEQLARSHDLPWLGVFGRHWELQHFLLEQGQVTDWLGPAVEAFTAAHQPENLECPQTICSAQDLAIAYALADAKGYADEVITACEETLARIDATWPCYDCVGRELVDGLASAGRHDEAIRVVEETTVAIRGAGLNPTLGFVGRRIASHIEEGRVDEAVKLADTTVIERFDQHGDGSLRAFNLDRALAFAHGGRAEEAKAILAEVRPLDQPRYAESWRRVADQLLQTGDQENDEGLGAVKVMLTEQMFQRGTMRMAFDAAISAGTWAGRRGSLASARRSLARAEEIANHLAKPCGAPDEIANLLAEIEDASGRTFELQPLDERVEELEALRSAGKLNFDETQELGRLLGLQGWTDAGADLLWELVRTDPANKKASMTLMGLIYAKRLPAQALQSELSQLAEEIDEADEADSFWVRANAANSAGDWNDVARYCSMIVERDDSVVNTRRLWAHAEYQRENHAESARLWAEILTRSAPSAEQADSEETEDEKHERQHQASSFSVDCWSAAVAGTLGEDWALVRRACAFVDVDLATEEGPIDERWHRCRIELTEDDGSVTFHFADRTGPCTARVTSVASPMRPQHVNDVVVFFPQPTEPMPDEADEEAQANFVVTYRAVGSLKPAGYSSQLLRGVVMPDDAGVEQVRNLQQALDEVGFASDWWTGGRGRLADGTESEELVLMIGVPPDATLETLADVLEASTSDWPHEPTWIGIAEETGRDADAHRARLDARWADED